MKTQNPRQPEHILVVDDDKAFRLATKTLLEDEFNVRLMADGNEPGGFRE